MPIENFLKIDDAKQTVEKPASPRKSTQELTTVVHPGKPTPTNLLEESSLKNSKNKTRKRKTPKKEPNSITPPKKEYTLIITEKPQSAQKIAFAISPTARKISEGKVSYFDFIYEGEKILVASAVGHLFNLTYKPGTSGWPVFDTIWVPSYNTKGASFTKPYFNLLEKLSKKSKSFIIATDFDIEGEVIGWNILRFIAKEKSARRMKYSTLTKDELLNSFKNPLKEPDWGQAYAGETRHIIDWLYGINLSRALMSSLKKTGIFKILSIGRVQGPTLKIIVDREREIENFVSEPFWQIFAKVLNIDFPLYKHSKDIFDKKNIKPFLNVKKCNAQTITTPDSLPPNPPFDLTSLQRESYRLYKYSPSRTLAIAQKLYLAGLISYPRTSSQKIPESVKPRNILKNLEANFPEAKNTSRKKPVEGKNTDPAHPSIYPTGEFSKTLESNERKLYNLIAKRFISCFYQDAKLERRKTILKDINNPKLDFTASGLKIIDKSWISVYPSFLEEKEIPNLNGLVNIEKISFEEKETQPPKRFTPTSLLTTLERKNLGTKATRSSIIDILFNRGYLDGKSIKATPLGLKLIETLEKYSSIIIDENLTRQLEENMEEILRSKKDFIEKEDILINKTKKIIEDISKEFKSQESKIGLSISEAISEERKVQNKQGELMPCPKCKEGTLRILYSKKTKKQFVACSAYPDCKTTYSLPPNSMIKNTGKKNEDNLPILQAIRKGRKPWIFPFNPNWKENQKQKK